jgi:Sec-independent protein secretion pathway component TatC
MARTRFRQFLAKSLSVVALAFLLGAILAPPDPFTQLCYTVPVLVVGMPYS